MFAAGTVVKLAFAPLLFAALPDDGVFADAFEGRQYAAFDGWAATVGDGGEVAAELLVDLVIGSVLGQLATLFDGLEHPGCHVGGFEWFLVGGIVSVFRHCISIHRDGVDGK